MSGENSAMVLQFTRSAKKYLEGDLLESAVRVYSGFLKLLSENVMCWWSYMQWLKTILTTEQNFENGSKWTWTRMHSLWTWFFSLMRQHSSSVVQWTDTISRTVLLKIRTFMLTRQWIYQDLQFGVLCHPGVLRDCTSLKGELLVLSTSACLSYELCPPFISCMEMRKFTTNKTGDPALPSWYQGLSWWQFPRLVYLPRKKCSVPPRSPDFTALDVYLWDCLKDSVYNTKPATLLELRHGIEQICAAYAADTLVNVCHSVVCLCQQCLEVNGGHFNIYDIFQCSKYIASAHTKYRPLLNYVTGIFYWKVYVFVETLCTSIRWPASPLLVVLELTKTQHNFSLLSHLVCRLCSRVVQLVDSTFMNGLGLSGGLYRINLHYFSHETVTLWNMFQNLS
jgi:hypothetical protein